MRSPIQLDTVRHARTHITALRTVLAVFALTWSGADAWGEEESTAQELPGYYEFFMKAGQQKRIEAEVKRDEEIRKGELEPVAVDRPALDLQLPDGYEHHFGPRDFIGEKNLVLITGRAWW